MYSPAEPFKIKAGRNMQDSHNASWGCSDSMGVSASSLSFWLLTLMFSPAEPYKFRVSVTALQARMFQTYQK
jgi:hypothetical protein